MNADRHNATCRQTKGDDDMSSPSSCANSTAPGCGADRALQQRNPRRPAAIDDPIAARRSPAPRRCAACGGRTCTDATGRCRRRCSGAARPPAAACATRIAAGPGPRESATAAAERSAFTRMPMELISNARLSSGYHRRMSPLRPLQPLIGGRDPVVIIRGPAVMNRAVGQLAADADHEDRPAFFHDPVLPLPRPDVGPPLEQLLRMDEA